MERISFRGIYSVSDLRRKLANCLAPLKGEVLVWADFELDRFPGEVKESVPDATGNSIEEKTA